MDGSANLYRQGSQFSRLCAPDANPQTWFRGQASRLHLSLDHWSQLIWTPEMTPQHDGSRHRSRESDCQKVQEFATFVASPTNEGQPRLEIHLYRPTRSCHLLWLLLPIGFNQILWTDTLRTGRRVSICLQFRFRFAVPHGCTPALCRLPLCLLSVRNKLAVASSFTCVWLT